MGDWSHCLWRKNSLSTLSSIMSSMLRLSRSNDLPRFQDFCGRFQWGALYSQIQHLDGERVLFGRSFGNFHAQAIHDQRTLDASRLPDNWRKSPRLWKTSSHRAPFLMPLSKFTGSQITCSILMSEHTAQRSGVPTQVELPISNYNHFLETCPSSFF